MTDLKKFHGDFLVWRLSSKGFRRRDGGGARLPRFRHKSFESATTEAERLSDAFPESTFVIIQEVARVKGNITIPLTDGMTVEL